jgi:hypothetical protein
VSRLQNEDPLRTIRFGVLTFVAYFCLTYLEPLSFGGLKFALMWRAAFTGLALAYLVMRERRPPAPRTAGAIDAMRPLAVAWIAYALVPLASALFGTAPLADETPVAGIRALPLLAALLLLATDARAFTERLLSVFPFFLCAVSPLLLLGIIEPTGYVFELDHLGVEGRAAYIGTFQNQHSAALAHSIAALFAWDRFLRPGTSRPVWYFAAYVGCALLTALTTARSGLIGLALGTVAIAWTHRRMWALAYPAWCTTGGVVLLALLRPDLLEVTVDRLLGRSLFQTTLNLDTFTSGRTMLQAAALHGFERLDLLEKLVGIGQVGSVEMIGQLTGLFLMAHNVFIDEMVRYGLLGLATLLVMLAVGLALAWRNARRGEPLGLAAWMTLVSFASFQSLDYSFQLAMVSAILALETLRTCDARARVPLQGRGQAPGLVHLTIPMGSAGIKPSPLRSAALKPLSRGGGVPMRVGSLPRRPRR